MPGEHCCHSRGGFASTECKILGQLTRSAGSAAAPRISQTSSENSLIANSSHFRCDSQGLTVLPRDTGLEPKPRLLQGLDSFGLVASYGFYWLRYSQRLQQYPSETQEGLQAGQDLKAPPLQFRWLPWTAAASQQSLTKGLCPDIQLFASRRLLSRLAGIMTAELLSAIEQLPKAQLDSDSPHHSLACSRPPRPPARM